MKISIVTVTKNAASVLPGLIESLRAQTDRDFEWVVVDGASTDETVDMIKSAQDVVSRWVSEPDCGIYDAMNKAVGLANGDYYLVCGADDWLFPNAIANYRRVALETSADIVSACTESVSGLARPLRGKPWLRGHLAFVSQHSVGTLIRKHLHVMFGAYSLRFPVAADQYFIKRVCMSPGIKLVGADFLAGHYSMEGVSGTNFSATLTDFLRVQLVTERFASLQVLLYMLRLASGFRKLVSREAINRRSGA